MKDQKASGTKPNNLLTKALFVFLFSQYIHSQPSIIATQINAPSQTPGLSLTSQTNPLMYAPKPNMMYPAPQPMAYQPYQQPFQAPRMVPYSGYQPNPMMMPPMSPYAQAMPYNMYSQYPRGLVQSPQPTPQDRQLKTINLERTKLVNFMVQFLLVSKRHSFVTYLKFKGFYITYLENAEETFHINHQERVYLEYLNTYIFLSSYSHFTLHYPQIENHFHYLFAHEHTDILLAVSNNQPFTHRVDYTFSDSAASVQNTLSSSRIKHASKRSSLSKGQSGRFVREYSQLQKLLHNERSWHKSLRSGKKNKISSIRRRELKKSIRAGQKKVKRLLKALKIFERTSKNHKLSQLIKQKLKVVKYFLEHLFEHSMGRFFVKLSTFYHEKGLDEKRKSAATRTALKKKVRNLLVRDKPLRFLISVHRSLKMNQKIIRKNILKIKKKAAKKRGQIKNMNRIFKGIADPREVAILEIYVQQTRLRIKEIDFFLFDTPGDYFELDLIRLLDSLMNFPSARDFIQFNANLDLLFIQIAKIEAHLGAGREISILPTVRQKYFLFFQKLIQPLVNAKPTFDLAEIERKDKEVFENLKAIRAFQKVISMHLKNDYQGMKVGDLEMSYLTEEQELSFEDDVHDFLKQKKQKGDSSKPLWDQDEDLSWGSEDMFYNTEEGRLRGDGSEVDNDEIRQFDDLQKEFVDNQDTDSESGTGGDIRPGNRRRDRPSDTTPRNQSGTQVNSQAKSHKSTKSGGVSGNTNGSQGSVDSSGNIKPGNKKRDNTQHSERSSLSDSESARKKKHLNKSEQEELTDGSISDIRPGHRRKDKDNGSSNRRSENESLESGATGDIKPGNKRREKDVESTDRSQSQATDSSHLLNNSQNQSDREHPNRKKNRSQEIESGDQSQTTSGKNKSKKTQSLDQESEDTAPLGKVNRNSQKKMKKKKRLDQDEDETIHINDYDTDDGEVDEVANLNVKLKKNKALDDAEVEITHEQRTPKTKSGPKGPRFKNVPVKINKKTIRKRVWENGGFKKRKKKYDDKAFQADEDLIDSMVVSMGDLKKVKVNKLLVLKAKILSELFLAFFRSENEDTTVQMLSVSRALDEDGIIKKSVSKKLNYLLMIVVEGRKLRQGMVANPYFDDVIRLWKLFLVEYSSTCQLKLYLKLLRKMDLIDPPRRRIVWTNLVLFLKEHRQYSFVTCPQMVLSMWMNKTILAKQVANTTTVRASFQKVYVKYKHQQHVKSTERKKSLLKKILNKIRTHTADDAELQHFDKTILFSPLAPGNKKKDPSSPNSQKDILEQRFKGSTIQSLMRKPSMAKLMGHLQKLKLKSNKKVKKDLMKFTKSLVIGALLSGQNVHSALSGLSKMRFKMTHKKLAYIERLKTEFRNVDNIRISDKYHHIFANLRKIFFKPKPEKEKDLSTPSEHTSHHSSHHSTPKSHHSIYSSHQSSHHWSPPSKKFSPPNSSFQKSFHASIRSHHSSYHSEASTFSEESEHRRRIEPPMKRKRGRKWGQKISRKKTTCRTRIFKKCKCEGSGSMGMAGSGGGGGGGGDTGCCDGNVGDDSIYNYRPSYDFKFEFDDPEELAQFEEFLRTTDSIDKMFSSNMIDVEKARQEFKKAEFSKHYNILVNGKKGAPENILIPKAPLDNKGPDKGCNSPKNKQSPSKRNPDNASQLSHPVNDSQHQSNATGNLSHNESRPFNSNMGSHQSSPKNQTDTNHSANNSNPDTINMKFNSLGEPLKKDIESPFNDDLWEQDMKRIDNGVRNQPSIEDGVHVREIPVDENGNPIDLTHQGDELDNKVTERDEQDQDIREFIKRNRPLQGNQASNPQNSQDINSHPSQIVDDLDAEVESVINKDINDQDLLDANPLKLKPNGDMIDETQIMGLESPQELASRGDAIDNRHVNLTDIDGSEVSHDGIMDGIDPLNRPQKLDNVYSGELVDHVEDELDQNLPMKRYKFGAKDWATDQVYTNTIKDEGMLGSSINKYPAMSDAMKVRLDTEIKDNGGYPDDLDANPGQKKMVYFPFQVDHGGNIQFDPNSNQQFLI